MPSWIVGVGAEGTRLARERAAQDGRQVLSTDSFQDPRIDEVAATADSVLVVAESLSHSEAVSILERLAAVDRTAAADPFDVGCPVGFLHAGSPEALRALSARQAGDAGREGDATAATHDVLVDCTLSEVPETPAGELTVLPYRGITSAALRDRGRMRLLAVTAHGMGDLIHLDDDYICGRSRSAPTVSRTSDPLPSCASAPGACVFKQQGTAIPGYELQADHVFFNACGTSRFERGEFGPAFSLWYSVLEGTARSYVGSVRWKDGHGLEGLLYRHLLHAGYPLGLAVAVLNRVLRQHHLEQGQVHCLLGDPVDRATDRLPPDIAGEILPGRTKLDIAHGFAHYVVRDPELLAAWEDQKLLLHAEEGADVSFSVVPSRTERVLHVFATSYADLDTPISVVTTDYRPTQDRIADIRASVSTTLSPALGVGGMYPNTARQGDRANLENRILNIARLFRRSRTDEAAVPKLLQNVRRLEQEVAKLDQKTAAELHRRIRDTVYRFSEHYQDSFELLEVRTGRPCHLCGLHTAQRVQRSLVDARTTRLETICPGCGTLEDVPDDRLLVRLDSISPVGRTEEFQARLTVVNDTPATVSALCVAGVRRAQEYGASGPDGMTAVSIPPGDAETVEFPFRFSRSTLPHQYDIQSAVVATGRIYMARRPIWVHHG